MHDKEALCQKIKGLYPDIGQCGIDVAVDWDEDKGYYVVDLKKGVHELKHFLPKEDADLCMSGKQCVALGLEIAQLKDNVTQA